MAEPIRRLEAAALKLPDKERAELAKVLLLSLDRFEDEETEAAWAEEAVRRYLDLESGAVEALPSDQVLAEARARLR